MFSVRSLCYLCIITKLFSLCWLTFYNFADFVFTADVFPCVVFRAFIPNFLFCFVLGSHCCSSCCPETYSVNQAVLDLTKICFLSAGIKGVSHHSPDSGFWSQQALLQCRTYQRSEADLEVLPYYLLHNRVNLEPWLLNTKFWKIASRR